MDHGTMSSRQAAAGRDGITRPADTAAAHRQSKSRRLRAPSFWPLLIILGAQAALSLRLVRADTAFQDEALYLWAGHREWAHLLHGLTSPPFSSYFSGSPIIYPLVGALADSVGGLVAARTLSLIFMLGATALLWDSTRRLFGYRAAFFAAALFAVLGSTLHLGSFATFDALAILMLALSSWCVIHAAARQDATGRLILAGAALALANATGYWTILFDPVLVLLALLTAMPRLGGRLAARRTVILFTVVIVLGTAGLLAGGGGYINGLMQTTLARVPGTDAATRVFVDSWSWVGFIAVLALAGVIAGWVSRLGRPDRWMLTVLAGAIVLVPADQALIHAAASLNKHDTAGAWFAAVAAGYAVDRFIAQAHGRRLTMITTAACVTALVAPADIGAAQATNFATQWPNTTHIMAILGQLTARANGRFLVEDPSLAEYYLPAGQHWMRWSSTRNIVLPTGASTGGPSAAAGVVGAGNAGVFAVFIQEGYFSLVALNFADTTSLDHRIAADLRANPRYKIIDVIPYAPVPGGPVNGTYVVWKYEPRR